MISPECTNDLNFLMNHMVKLGMEYKQLQWTFKLTGDSGICAFLRTEKMERYYLATGIADYLTCNNAPVLFTKRPAPSFKVSDINSLKGLVGFEKATVDAVETMIKSATDRGAEKVKIFLLKLHAKCLKEYNDVLGVVGAIEKVMDDPAGINAYQWYLEDEYGNYVK